MYQHLRSAVTTGLTHTKVCLPHTLSSSGTKVSACQSQGWQLLTPCGRNSTRGIPVSSHSRLTNMASACEKQVRKACSAAVVPQAGAQHHYTCSGLAVFCRESKAQSAHTHARLTNQLQGRPVRCCAVNYQDLPARLEWAA